MGSVTYRDGLSVIDLIAFLPSFFVSAFLVWRHGLRRSGGFIFLVIFTLLRVVGAGCALAAINNPSTGLYTAAAVCSSIGLSPLLMGCVGMLSRANESIANTTSRPVLPRHAFTAFRVITIVALALSVSGLTWDMSIEALKNPNTEVKVGMVLYLVSWALLCGMLGILFLCRSSLEDGENRNLAAVAISAPFLMIRIIYSMLVFFLANSTFNILDGNVTVQLVMSVIEEIIVVFVCLGIGYTLRVREKPAHDYKTLSPKVEAV
ncbi:hypothetical protein N7492_008604 [Penicillium capsulatum]|uniref:DUF7702 domain-containing protein n=1 Tax=Penicillium capsulatum TaxID=69766 RepID=A0A9W9LG32_9EURO|nr:hypothetical protein N7492_008604 [Penicillium capsulatum]KAJ6106009.1 hypothetical protein N7512_009526 [Penicillium capsulatum]